VSNIVILVVVGALCFEYYEQPEASVFGGIAWALAIVLTRLVPFTDPYREPRSRRKARRFIKVRRSRGQV